MYLLLVIISLQFVCVCVCMCVSVCVCVCLYVSEQNSRWTDAMIWTWFSLNGCLSHWLEPYWNWWPLVNGQGHSDVLSIFLHISLLTSPLCISALLYTIKMKFGRFVFECHKNWINDDVIASIIVVERMQEPQVVINGHLLV